MHKFALLITYLLCITTPVQASDLAKEKRWADQIVDYLIDGEAEWLEVGKQKVLGIYTEAATETTKGGAIIVHGIGAHPNWDDVIRPIRTHLPEYGWDTLSVQMPILANEAEDIEYAPLFDEVTPRMKAAIQFFKQKNINNIIIVGHSMGSAMSAYYLASNKNHPIKAFIGVGIPEPQNDKRMDTNQIIQQIQIPVLDLYGRNDLPGILKNASKRKQAANKNKNYVQVNAKDANHFFNNQNDTLMGEITKFLDGKL